MKIISTSVINDSLDLEVIVQNELDNLITFQFSCVQMTTMGWQDLSYNMYDQSIIELIEAHLPNWTPEIKETFKQKKEFEYSQMLSAGYDQQIPDEEINAILANI